MNQAKSQDALPELQAMHFTNVLIYSIDPGFSAPKTKQKKLL